MKHSYVGIVEKFKGFGVGISTHYYLRDGEKIIPTQSMLSRYEGKEVIVTVDDGEEGLSRLEELQRHGMSSLQKSNENNSTKER